MKRKRMTKKEQQESALKKLEELNQRLKEDKEWKEQLHKEGNPTLVALYGKWYQK